MEYVCDFAQKLRTAWVLTIDAPAWFQLDGEAIQIAPFKDPATVEHFGNYCIICGKPPASTTEVTQPCDCGNCFKGSKTCFKDIKDADTPLDHLMVAGLKAVIAQHYATTKNPGRAEEEEEEEPSCKVITKKPKTSMTSSHRHCVLYGLLRIQKAISKSISRSTVQDSFRLAGIYPFSLKQIMSNCKTDMNYADLNEIEGAIPALAKLIVKQGGAVGQGHPKMDPLDASARPLRQGRPGFEPPQDCPTEFYCCTDARVGEGGGEGGGSGSGGAQEAQEGDQEEGRCGSTCRW
jgi:hypothetical protein